MPFTPFTLPGSDEHPILGDTHLPDAEPRGVLLLCHGFKGYKDYGFLPFLAHEAAHQGLIVHRFNFSHSGMTNNTATFERPDLFERDTWSRQVTDLGIIADAVDRGILPGSGLPQVWFGHSRGGVTVLLTAARRNTTARIVAAAAPARACSLDEQAQRLLLTHGAIDSPSTRTNQILRVGKAWLEEIRADPAGHDPLRAAGQLRGELLIVHGDSDATVPVEDAQIYAEAADTDRTALRIITKGNHVFNGRNPHRWDQPPAAPLRDLVDTTITFALNGPAAVIQNAATS